MKFRRPFNSPKSNALTSPILASSSSSSSFDSSTVPVSCSCGTSSTTRRRNSQRHAPPCICGKKISVLVKKNDLKNAQYHGLRKVSIWGMYNPLFKRRRVFIEAAPNNTPDRVFYVPPVASIHQTHATPTPAQYITVNKKDNIENLVWKNDDFQIEFIGMCVQPFDVTLSNNNELLLYSFSRSACREIPNHERSDSAAPEGASVAGEYGVIERDLNSEGSENNSGRNDDTRVAPVSRDRLPTPFSPGNDVPFIHYDPMIDGHDDGTAPNAFVPIPASKRIYKRYSHKMSDLRDLKCRPAMNIRFTVMEIDKVSDLQARSIVGLDRLGNYVSQNAASVPYIELLTNAFAFAANLGRDGLRKYSRPDHVLSVDENFLIADDDTREQPNEGLGRQSSVESVGNYLRYGYYYFLNREIDAKLYAQTSTSQQHMPLVMRRVSAKHLRLNEQEYFPLTGYSYVLIRVRRGCTTDGLERTPEQFEQCKTRLDNIIQTSNTINLLASVVKKRKKRSANAQ